MKPKTIPQVMQKKNKGEEITMLTCYDSWSAKLLAETEVDLLLVGDSAAMVMHGHNTTLSATVEMMAVHTQAVCRAAPNQLVVADMPFLSYRKDRVDTLNAVQAFMQAGAHAVKLEGLDGHEDLVTAIVQSGVPVMGHLGLTPQYLHQLGGFKVQGRDDVAIEHLLRQAIALERLGCFSLVLECVPAAVAQLITQQISIPTIGIGAGPYVDGQVLVFHDLLGLNKGFKPKFLKTYLQGADLIQKAIQQFVDEVNQNTFPSEEESYK